jgi:hypothetical protein
MLSEALGAGGIAVPLGRQGCARYGPYKEAPSGHLRVAFRCFPDRRFRPMPPGDPIVAYVDVVGNFGRRFFAADFVLASELRRGGVVTLDAALPEPAADEGELGRELRAALSLLRPHRVSRMG